MKVETDDISIVSPVGSISSDVVTPSTPSIKAAFNRNFIDEETLETTAEIRRKLRETQKELACYQIIVAALEAEKLLRSEERAPRAPYVQDCSSRLYLPESEGVKDNNSNNGSVMNSVYDDEDINVFDAVNSGDAESLCDILLYSPQSVYSINQEGRTALHIACMSNNHVLALLLIQYGAVINASDAAGQTPMHLCSDAAMVHLLCQRGGSTHIRDNHSFTPLYVHTIHCREELVNNLLAHNADPMLVDPVTQRNALHCAADMLNFNIISMLLMTKTAQEFINNVDKDGNTAIHIIVANRPETLNLGNSTHKVQGLLIQKCLMLLVNMGAKVNIQNNRGDSPLHLLCSNLHLRATLTTAPLVEIMLDMAADPNAADTGGCRPLMVAAAHGEWEVCESLVRAGADINASCSITSSFLLNNQKDFQKYIDNNHYHNIDLTSNLCKPSDIIPKKMLLQLYNYISAPQSMVIKGNQKRCPQCLETKEFDLEPAKDISFITSLLGLGLGGITGFDYSTAPLQTTENNDNNHNNLTNNCRHCGRYLCSKCLSHSLLAALMPQYCKESLNLNPAVKTSGGMSFSFYEPNSENVKLCHTCYNVFVK